MQLDEQLNLDHHIREKIAKANKGIGVIWWRKNIIKKYNIQPR